MHLTAEQRAQIDRFVSERQSGTIEFQLRDGKVMAVRVALYLKTPTEPSRIAGRSGDSVD